MGLIQLGSEPSTVHPHLALVTSVYIKREATSHLSGPPLSPFHLTCLEGALQMLPSAVQLVTKLTTVSKIQAP